MASPQGEGTERLAAWIEECRVTGTTGDQQDLQQRLLKELLAIQERWSSIATPNRGSATGSLFQLLLQALLVYSGNHPGSATGGVGSSMTIPLISSAVETSESVLNLFCELLAKAYDYAAAPVVSDNLSSKHTSLYIKTALVMVIARLSAQDASQFVTEAVAFANKNVRAADYYMKQCLVESVARMLHNSSSSGSRLAGCHVDALKIVTKTFQDKIPEVRIAAAGLLHVLALRTSTISNTHSSSSSAHASGSAGVSSNGSGAGGVGGSASANPSGMNGADGSSGAMHLSTSSGRHSTSGVTLEAIMQTAYKGMDDVAPEARRAFAVVVGIVLAKFVAFGSYDGHDGSHSHGHAPATDADGSLHGNDGSADGGSAVSKSKSLGFKLAGMQMPGMSTLTLSSLSRRKGGAASADFSSVASVILYLKDLLVAKFLSSAPSHGQQHHGGMLAAYAVALCSMFERLPVDVIVDSQLDDIVQAILSLLDHQLTLPDLTRARNAVCFALRFGVNIALTERQQGALLGVYVQIGGSGVDNEAMNHHKVLAVLVETSHLVQSLGEASVVHADDAMHVLHGLLSHEKQSLRFQAAVAMASLLTALPYKLKSCMLDCLSSLRETSSLLLKDNFDRLDSGDEETPTKAIKGKAQLYAVQGYSTAISHIVRAFVLQQTSSGRGGLSHSMLSSIMNLAERLVESQFIDGCTDSIWLTCTRAGWNLIGSLVTVKDEHWIHGWMRKLADMWLRSSILHTREASLELLRIEAAVVAMHSFLYSCRDAIVKSDSLQMLTAHVLHSYLVATRGQLAKPQKRRGQIARHRLITWIMKCFTVLPPVYSDSYITLLEMITEFTTAQSLTSLNHSPLHPATSTFLCNALSGADDPLDMVSTSRLVAGDDPSVLYSRELNHILALLQSENALSDTEVEVQYLDNFWGLLCESFCGTKNDVYDRAMCSSFTYVRLVDASVFLFGKMFHHLPEDLQLRCLQHFTSVLTDGRLDCEVNVCAMVFAIVKQAKSSLGTATLPVSASVSSSWPHQVQTMMSEMVSSENSTIRRGASETLGLLASILPDEQAKALVQELEKRLVAAEKLPTGTSINGTAGSAPIDSSVLAAGASFALACVKRSCGSGIYVDPGLIYRFAGEIAQPLRTWILHSWSIIVDSVSASGGDYEQYVKSSASLIEAHLVAGFRYSNKTNKKWLRYDISSRVAIGRIINGVVATLGPELATSHELLTEFYTLWGLLRQDGYDTRVELEYLKFIEQVVVFAPARFDASDLVYILSIVSDAFAGAALSSDALSSLSPSPSAMVDSGGIAQSPPSHITADSLFGSLGNHHSSRNVLVCVNGLARNILQQVGMSCLRTLAERDPSVIRRYNLQCLLFHALHVESNALTWRYLPGLHGMWDVSSFKFFIPCKSRDGLAEIQHTILALIDIDGGNWGSCQPCVWALFCRGIAIGESSSAASSNENLMMSPKGIEMLPIPGLGGDPKDLDASGWTQSRNTGTHAATGAATAQVEAWRRTKRHVRLLLSLIPVLSRQVRRFAVECVVRVFDLVGRGAEADIKPHFDLVEARARFLASVAAMDESDPESSSEQLQGLNFLSMYVDEFVTLACHATTLSADGNELQIFQCEGLRLLKVVLSKFVAARDPEMDADVASAFLLDPYQAQISSAVRHALKQVQSPADGADEDQDFYAPLAVEAFRLCGESVRCRLVQDKVAFGRILRMVVAKDYGHAHHFAGDEVTRVAVSLTNLACIANLVVTSLTAGDAAPQLAKALTSSISVAAMDNVVACWLDATACYGLLMQGFGPWPVALLPVSHDHKVIQSSVLKISIPVALPQLSASHSQSSSPTVDALRDIFKRNWPAYPIAVMTLLDANAVSANVVSGKLDVLLSYCVFHLITGVRDRQENDIVPVLRAIPRLLRALSSAPQWGEFVKTSIAALMFASTHTYATVRVACLTSLFECLTPNPTGAKATTTLPNDAMALAAQAALCPLQILTQIADPSKHRLSIGGRDDTTIVPDLLRFAAAGIVFVHTHHAVRASIFDAAPLVDRCVEFFVHHPDHFAAFTAVHRAVVESAITRLSDYGSSEEGEFYVETLSNSLGLVVELLQVTVAQEPVAEYQVEAAHFVYRLVSNFAVQLPPSLAHVASAFHGSVATQTLALIESQLHQQQQHVRDGSLVLGALVAGVRGVAQRLVDHQDTGNAQRYFGVLGAVSLTIFDSYRHSSALSSIADAQELVQVEQWLRLLSTQLNDTHGAAFARLMLPKLAELLLQMDSQPSPSEVRASVSSTLAKLLLSLAQTRPAAFKEVVGGMAPSSRAVLETTLRSALGGGGASSISAHAGGGVSASAGAGTGFGLDLSRYK